MRKTSRQRQRRNREGTSATLDGARKHAAARPSSARQDPLQAAVERHREGKLAAAEKLYRKVLRSYPNHSGALQNFAVLLRETRRMDEALEVQKQAAWIDPADPVCQTNLGNLLGECGRLDEAAEAYRRAVHFAPGYVDAHFNLGVLSRRRGDFDVALDCFNEVVRLAPGDTEGWRIRGEVLEGLGRLDESEAAYSVAAQLAPERADIHKLLARVCYAQKHLLAAEDAARLALDASPDDSEMLTVLGSVLRLTDRLGEAEAVFRRALANEPESAALHTELGVVSMAQGDLPAARQCYSRAIELDAANGAAWLNLIGTRRFGDNADDHETLTRLEAVSQRNDMPGRNAELIRFALGKVYDDLGRYAQAFEHYREGNRLHLEAAPFDRDAHRAFVDQTIGTFDSGFFAGLDGRGSTSERPVFIVGMPRSGTTLVEQILASHPAVFGAGELIQLFELAAVLPRRLGTDQVYPACARRIDAGLAQQLAEEYLAHLTHLDDQASIVTDKMPENFLNLGLAAALFPRARVVHCRREPMDVCLSLYFQRFEHGHEYAYDLADIGFYYQQYQRLISHWWAVLPNRICEIDYEALVEDQEAQTRRLVQFCGLEWDPACLSFHAADRPVQTASSWQVRQPMFKRSVARWKHYQQHLRGLEHSFQEWHANEGAMLEPKAAPAPALY